MLNKLILKIILFNIIFLFAGVCFSASTNKSAIKIGMTAPLTGELKPVGEGVRVGIQVYFDKINATGGIEGKKLELIALDDAYDPLTAAKNVHELLDKNRVFAFMGNMGSAPAIVTLPIIDENKVILFAPITGNNIYRKIPPDHYVFNFRASLDEEAAALVNGLLSIGIKPDEIAFFTQQDSFGQNVYHGATSALKAAGYAQPEKLAYATFVRGTLNVEDALTRIIRYAKVPLKAFILGGNYSTNAKFIKLAKKEYPNALFLSVSGRVNPSDFNINEEKNIITVELVPDLSSNLPAIIEFQNDMIKYGKGAKPDTNNLEGYLSAKLFVRALKKAAERNELNTEGVIKVLENMNDIDIGIGINLGFDKNHHQALRKVWPVLLKNGKFVPFNWTDLKEKNK